MNPWADLLVLIIETLATVYLLFIILRFLLQLARADFYNPFSQAVVKITNPALMPLRKIIPGLWGIDMASIALALLFHMLLAELIALILAGQFINPGMALLWGALGTLKVTTYIFTVCLIVLVVISFVAPYNSHPALMLIRQLMEPFTRPIQKVIPPVGGLDFSVFFLFLAIQVFQRILDIFAASVGLIPRLIIGYSG